MCFKKEYLLFLSLIVFTSNSTAYTDFQFEVPCDQVLSISYKQPYKVPYSETCEGGNKELTDKVTSRMKTFDIKEDLGRTEATSCVDGSCSESRSFVDEVSGLRNCAKITSDPVHSPIPPLCFYASYIRGTDLNGGRYYTCKGKEGLGDVNKENPTDDGKTTFCYNKSYTEMTAKAFNEMADCFGASYNERRQLFALFNHESRFTLNARSGGKARCYGQLTLGAIKDINKNIFLRDHGNNGSKHGDIYKSAAHKCPGIVEKLLPPKLVNPPKKGNYTNKIGQLKELQKNNNFTCGTTQDPYTCFFYSIFYAKMNAQYFDEHFNVPADYRTTSEPAPGVRRALGLSYNKIKKHEMLVIKGDLTINGVKRRREWVMWDDSEVLRTFARHKITAEETRKLEVKRVQVFDKDMLRAKFIQTGHNGGTSISSTHAGVFMEKIKKNIAAGTRCKKNKKCKEMRETIMSGESLSAEVFHDRWSRYTTQKRLTNRKEVRQFAKKIDEDIDLLQNKNTTYPLASALPQDVKDSLSDSEERRFVQEVKNSCPKKGH